MKNDHGQPSTYANYKCRCDLCREAASKYHREYRKTHRNSDRATSRATNLAAKWVRRKHPKVWEGFMDEAYEHIGAERKPVGWHR